MNQIFNENLYEKKELIILLNQLVGNKQYKPFECVGTYNEILLGLYLGIQKHIAKNNKLPFLLEYAKHNLKDLKFKHINPQLINSWSDKNYLPIEFTSLLKSKISD